jgi:hypothetical protein
MIEIEAFQREPSCGVHTLKIWINGNLSFANEICKASEIVELRDAIHNELLWLNDHIRKLGLDK